MTFAACYRSWRTVWCSLWLDVSSPLTVSDALWGFLCHLKSRSWKKYYKTIKKKRWNFVFLWSYLHKWWVNEYLCLKSCFFSVYLGSSLPLHLRRSTGQVVQRAGAGFRLWSSYLGQNPSAQVRNLHPEKIKSQTIFTHFWFINTPLLRLFLIFLHIQTW